MKLNDKEMAFVEAYLKTGNAYQSALSAGYSKHTAKGHSASWLIPGHKSFKQHIYDFIQQQTNNKTNALIVTVEEALEITSAIARGTPEIIYYKNQDGKTIQKEVRPTKGDQLKALDQIFKVNGAFTEKREVNQTGTVSIRIDFGDDDDDDG